MKTILILTNSVNGLYSFRKELVEKLIKCNYYIIISSPYDTKTSFFDKIGCKTIVSKLNRRGTNPISDLILLIKYIYLIKRVKPDVVLTYTIKPNVYGGIACRFLGIPYIVNVTGLGTSIENKGIIRVISLLLYRIGLRKASIIYFQNSANKNFLTSKKVINEERIIQIPGSGVNLNEHKFEDYPEERENIRFLFIGRIMYDKGVNELFNAAEIIKKDYPNVEFHLIGNKEENYDSKIEKLVKKNVICYHGYQERIHNFIKNSHAIINPSYHEGMSNVLLEAASTGRPVIATLVPGCIETFDEGISGFGFEAKNVDSLVKTLAKFINLSYKEKQKMGIAGRNKMCKEFNREIVVHSYLKEIHRIINGTR